MTTAAVYGCSGPRLTEAERAFFAEARPWGFILFRRNIETPEQVRALTDDLRLHPIADAQTLAPLGLIMRREAPRSALAEACFALNRISSNPS